MGDFIRTGLGIASGGLTEIANAATGNKIFPANQSQQAATPVPQLPGVDPRLVQAQNDQFQQAQDFKNNLGSYKQKQYSLAEDQAKQQLNQQNKSINQSANSRGLLYSGLRQGAQAGAAAQSAGDLASKRAGINQSADQQAASMQNQAVQTGLQVQGLQNQRDSAQSNLEAQQKALDYNAQMAKQPKGLLGLMGIGG